MGLEAACIVTVKESIDFQIILGHIEMLHAVAFSDHKVKLPNFTLNSIYFILDSVATLGQTSALDLSSVDLVLGCSPPAFLEKVVICG